MISDVTDFTDMVGSGAVSSALSDFTDMPNSGVLNDFTDMVGSGCLVPRVSLEI